MTLPTSHSPTLPLSPHFAVPRYDGPCFARLPDLARAVFTGGKVPWSIKRDLTQIDTLVFLFVDGFGMQLFEHYREFLSSLDLFTESEVFAGRSQFPSTTAAHVTTLGTGLSVGEHGIYEWYYYEPQVGEVILPLVYSLQATRSRDSLCSIAPPETILPFRTLYEEFNDAHVESVMIEPAAISGSAYGSAIHRGATSRGYSSLRHAGDLLAEAVDGGAPQRRFLNLYFDGIDGAGHEYGVHSPQHESAVRDFFTMLGSAVRSMRKERTLLVLFADHGIASLSPETTRYIDHELPHFARLLQRSRTGRVLAPCGSPRDLFLHVHPEHAQEAVEILRTQFAGIAETVLSSELIDAGYFGPRVGPRLRERLGNVVVLPFDGHGVFWSSDGEFHQHFLGNHGGLTPAELEIPIVLF